MKHIAKIQSEFLKLARKWDDLSLEEQKSYLTRHPKSKRKITAKPSHSTKLETPTSRTKVSEPKTKEEMLKVLDNWGYSTEIWKNLNENALRQKIRKDGRYSMYFHQEKPANGTIFGCKDGGKPEDVTEKQLSEALDKIIDARNNGTLDKVKKELPEKILSEMSYSRWRYIAPEFRGKSTKGQEIQQTSLQTKKFQLRAEKAEKLMQKGNVISVKTGEVTNYYKLDQKGTLWESKNPTIGFKVSDEQKLPEKIKSITNEGPQLETYYTNGNTYFKTTKEIPAWVNTGKTAPTNAYYGNSQIHRHVYEKKMLPKGTAVQLLAGGDFVVIDGQRKGVRFTDPVGDPSPFEKQYGYDPSAHEIPLSALAKTNEVGKVISQPKAKDLPAIGEMPLDNPNIKPIQVGQYVKTPNGEITKATKVAFGDSRAVGATGPMDLDDDQDERKMWWASFENGEIWPITKDFTIHAYGSKIHKDLAQKAEDLKKQKEEAKNLEDKKKGVWPEERIASSFKSLAKSLGQSAWMHDDEPSIDKDADGRITSVSIGVRDLGDWISHPGEEDDDYKEWSDKSYNKYKTIFEDWIKKQPWFDENTMQIDLDTGEKSWAYFGINRKRK